MLDKALAQALQPRKHGRKPKTKRIIGIMSPKLSFSKWLQVRTSKVGRHSLRVLTERDGSRSSILHDLLDLVRGHYVDPKLTAKRLASLGAPKTAALLSEHVPTGKKARSGDLGEVLATELAEWKLQYNVPIKRLRWKDGREMALRGDDIIGVMHNNENKLLLLKGESKSRAALSAAVLDEAGAVLDRDCGRPTRHSVLFVAERLRESGEDDLAEELEEAVLASFHGIQVAHMLFVLTGSPPENLLETHLKGAAKKKPVRHAVGVHIKDHAKFIEILFEGL
jgi:hypothetical protein